MSDLWAEVSNMWAHGIAIGPRPEENCEMCPHPWGLHKMHAVGDDPRDGGMTSCPSCDCVGTWSAREQQEVCGWGRSLKHKDGRGVCPEMSTGILVVFDGLREIEIPLCDKHGQEMEELGS